MVELRQIVRGVNVSFDTAVCPSPHKVCVWWQTDGDVPAHSCLLAPISFASCAREREALTEGASRSAALKLIGGASHYGEKSQDKEAPLREELILICDRCKGKCWKHDDKTM